MKLFANWFGTPQPVAKARGTHNRLRVALISDELTGACLEEECTVLHVTPSNARRVFTDHRPDLLFVESAWSGHANAWKYRIASYADHPERTNAELARVVSMARERHVPAVFWNKEDGVHFERFINSARLFDHVFTVDALCVERYRRAMGADANIGTLMFAAEPAFHYFTGFADRLSRACFVGSYSQHIHDARRGRQHLLLEAAARNLGLTIHDRNSDRRGAQYRYPDLPNTSIAGKLRYAETASVYKRHLVSLNVNTVENSPTMFSRRLVEILACGGLAVSTPALAIDRLFGGLCHVVESAAHADELFSRLRLEGYSEREREMMAAGARCVTEHHTWSRRIETLLDAIAHRR